MKLQVITLAFLLVSFCAGNQIVWGPSSFMTINTPSLQTTEKINDAVEDSARFAVEEINQQKTMNDELQIREIETQAAQIGEAILYSCTLEVHSGLQLAFEFLQPLDVQSTWMRYSLPTEGTISLADVFQSPRLASLELSGPMYLQFPKSRDDIRLRLPNDIDAGSFKKIRMNPGVTVEGRGINGVSLVDPVEIELSHNPFNDKVALSWKQVPRLELKGDSISFHSQERIKVKRRTFEEVEFVNTTATDMFAKPFLEFDSNHLIIQYLDQVMNQANQIADSTHSQQPRKNVHKLVSGTAEAVTLFLVPLHLEEANSGLVTQWDVAVSKDSMGNKKLVSFREKKIGYDVTYEEGAMKNSTMIEMMETFQQMKNRKAITDQDDSE